MDIISYFQIVGIVGDSTGASTLPKQKHHHLVNDTPSTDWRLEVKESGNVLQSNKLLVP